MLANMMRRLENVAPSRRSFLIGSSAVAGGLAVGFQPARAASAATGGVTPFNAYVRIAPDNTVTVISAHMDMGQGIYDGIATLVAEELDADWSQMKTMGGAGDPKLYGNPAWGGAIQGTGGSTGMPASWERYRIAGAAARQMLVSAAAAEWRVSAGDIRVANGVISHPSGRTARFGEMAAKAAALPAPANVTLKEPKDWVFIGNDKLRRLDSMAKSNGKMDFTGDVKLPGMLTAVPIHPPLFGATLTSFDATKAKAIKGVVDVVRHPRGLAVVAVDMWSAIKGREAVTAVWDDSKAEKRSSVDLAKEYRALSLKPGIANARNDGNAETAIAGAARTIEATFEFPYIAHAALEPLNAVVRRNADGTIEIWGGHQMPDIYQGTAAAIAGVPPNQIKMHVMKTGGGFGRRAVIDADVIVEAVAVAKAIDFRAPVKMQWTREDDMRAGRYRPAYVHRLKAGIDKDGKIVGWYNHIVGQSIVAGTPFAAGLVKNGVDLTSVEGANNLPYKFAAQKVDLTTTTTGVPVLWWRAVGSTHTAYAVEVFLDEVAAMTGKDPYEYRMSLLDPASKHAGVLKLAAEKAGWGTPLPAGRFRGIAMAESFDTEVAQVVEISMRPNGSFKVERVVCAVNCGVAVNPDNVRAQMEGGIGFGLGAVMKSQTTLDKGRVVEGNFDSHEVLRFDEMPVVEVHIVPSTDKPSGVGEPGVPPIGPAVANAIFAATKRRMHVLPFARGENA
ncbi:MAG: molybdopterin cofactor-binding domain-containing protein [Bosea sp. (in: a-proteobacteria)]